MGKEVKDIIKERREAMGLSLNDLGEKVGVNPSTIMRWEKGDIANMKRDKISALAKALDISPAIIMEWKDPYENPYDHPEQLRRLIHYFNLLSASSKDDLESYMEFLLQKQEEKNNVDRKD